MYSVTITGDSLETLTSAAAELTAVLVKRAPATSGVSGTASVGSTNDALSASDVARLRGDATVVQPKADAKTETVKGPTAADKKAAEKAAAKKAAEDEAAKKAAETPAEEPSTDTSADDEALDDGAAEGEALTHDDVKKLLLEVRAAFPKQATIVSEIVKDYGKVAAISKVDVKDLPAVAARCRELLATA